MFLGSRRRYAGVFESGAHGYHRFLRAGGHPHGNRTGRGHRLLPPPKKPRHVNLQTRKRRPLPHGKSRRSLIYAYRLYIASQRSAPTGTRTQNTRILSPLSLPIGLWGRTPHSSGHKHLLFHENAPEPKQKHISNGSPRSATAITTQKHRWATKPGSWRASGHKNGRCRRPKSSTPPFALSQVRYLREHTPKSGYFRALPSGVPVQYRLLPGMPGAGSAGGESRRCRGRRSGSVPRWS